MPKKVLLLTLIHTTVFLVGHLFDMGYIKIKLLKVLMAKSQLGMMELLEQKNALIKIFLGC